MRISPLLLLLAICPAANAEGLPWLVVGGGMTHMHAQTPAAEAGANALNSIGLTAIPGSTDDSDNSWKLGFGWDTGRYVAVEVDYNDLGRYQYDLAVNGAPASGEYHVRTAGVSMLPYADLGPVRLFGRLGLAYWKAENQVIGSGFKQPFREEGASPVFGAGADVVLGRYGYLWKLRAEWERQQDVGKGTDTGRGDIDVVTIGFVVEH